jgi:hypothetical protein
MRVAIVLGCAGMTTPLHAQQAPYCAQFSDGTSPSCTFATLQQCNASISDVGGVCNLNPAAPYQASRPAQYAQYQYRYRAAVQSDGHAAATAWRHVMTRSLLRRPPGSAA